jgi:hypothetical protein
MATATAMYHSGRNTLRKIHRELREEDAVDIVRGEKRRRLHKAFLRYHDANNWPLLREALRRMGRTDLIGAGKHQLIPAWQPQGTGNVGEGARRPHKLRNGKTVDSAPKTTPARTQHTGLKGVSLPKSRPTQNSKRKPSR